MSKSLFECTSLKLGCNAEMELELIPDPNIYIFFEKGARGRVPYTCDRYNKENNKYLKY